MDWTGGIALRLAIDYGHAFGRNGVEAVMQDSLIANAGTDGQNARGHRLIVARELNFQLRGVTIREESEPLGRVQARSLIVNNEIDLLGSARDIDCLIA